MPGFDRSWTAMLHASILLLFVSAACAPALTPDQAAKVDRPEPQRLKVLFLGDGGLHQPAERLRDVASPMLDRGIELVYTENLADLNLERLRRYDALLLYANYEGDFPRAQEEALLAYVAGGGGFVAVHSASANFRSSSRYVELLGGQFLSHGEGVFRTRTAEPDHEIMRGFAGFESWDETYVHHRHDRDNRTVLSYRADEPYTWIRTHGEGRVFYTAWGHDQRTWRNAGFHELLERGIRWAAGQNVQQALASRRIGNPFRYVVLDVPYPPPHQARLDYERTEGRPMDRRSNYPLWYRMQEPLSPQASMERMILPAGFRVELFAAEPDIVKPLAMAWDERGRLWVVQSVEYPYPRQLWPDGGGKDRITILEDTNGDGRADRFTDFASGLNIPTGITFADGGVIVHQAPQTLFLQDTNGDDRADVRRVLFEGWSQEDTHAGPSHLHYGLDNWIWGVLGYAGIDATIGGEHHKFGMGVYRFRKDGSKLEFLRRTNNNTWGLGFNEQGGAFISTANGNPSTYLPFARRHYSLVADLTDGVTESLASTVRIIPLTNLFRQVDWVGAYTAAAGHALYTARTYPKEYWNRIAFVAEPTGNLVGEFILEEKSSSYRAQHPRNLVASDDEWFSPVVADVGPDGHVWLADWYNYVNQHNAESDRQRPSPGNAYANPLRDRQHGRIYRIVYEGAASSERLSLAGASARKLIETLNHDNRLWRMHAQRLLVERGQADVVPALIALVEDRSVDEIGLNVGAIHALWTLHGLGQLDGRNERAIAAATGALRHPSFGVRRNAVQVLPKSQTTVNAILAARLLHDPNAQVRLATTVALADHAASADAGSALFAVLEQPSNLQDQWIREAATLAAVVHSRGFLAASDAAGLLADARRAQPEPPNLLGNPSFERFENGQPAGWTARTNAGSAELTVARGEGRQGGNALKLAARDSADAGWLGPAVPLKAATRYLLGGWIRTTSVERGTGRGAQFHVSGLPSAMTRTNPVVATTDWAYHERIFTTADSATGAFTVSLGGGGRSSGEVWVDDVVLKELGPEPGRTLESIVRLVVKHAPQMAVTDTSGVTGVVSTDAAVVLQLGVKPDVLQFDRNELRVKAGQRVRLVFTNTDHMPHNLVLIMPGALARIGQVADQMAASPQGRQQNYVPDSPDVLASTPVLEPAARFELTLTAPATPGEYTYVCTIPGHWRVMRGTLVVEPP